MDYSNRGRLGTAANPLSELAAKANDCAELIAAGLLVPNAVAAD